MNEKPVKPVTEKELGSNVPFIRLRRITGYLSEVSSFNDGKRAELRDRVKHSVGCNSCSE